MAASAWHRVALALLLALLGAQATPPHAHVAAGFDLAIVGAAAGEHATRGVDHAEDCLLCRVGARSRVFALAPAVALEPVSTPRIPVVDAAVRARRGPDLGDGPAPRAPPWLSPLA